MGATNHFCTLQFDGFIWHYGRESFLKANYRMSDVIGKCPSCDAQGEVGAPCEGKACQKRGYHFIPERFWERAAKSGLGSLDYTLETI